VGKLANDKGRASDALRSPVGRTSQHKKRLIRKIKQMQYDNQFISRELDVDERFRKQMLNCGCVKSLEAKTIICINHKSF